MPPRDTQRERVYRAERIAAGDDHWGQTIPNDQVQKWVDDVLARKAIRSRWGSWSIEVQFTHGGGHAFGSSLITLGLKARNPWYILHEIAHCLLPGHYAPHGPEFAGLQLWLVRTVMGDAEAKALLAAMRQQRVRRNSKGIPKPDRPVVTQKHRAERKRQAASRPLTRAERTDAATLIRRAVKAGHFGPAGRKPRTHALETARALET